jgi:hypothetical protein
MSNPYTGHLRFIIPLMILIPASIPAAERLQNSAEADTSASATPRTSIL